MTSLPSRPAATVAAAAARVASELGRDRPLHTQTRSMLGPARPRASARAWQIEVTVAVTGTVAVVHSPPFQTPSRRLDPRRLGPRLVALMIRLMARRLLDTSPGTA